MFNDNTNLLKALSNGEKLTELFRIELEKTINLLLKTELTEFLNYEKYDVAGYRSGNSRNGSYARVFKTEFGEITVDIPRDRNNEFSPIGIPSYSRTLGSLEDVVIHLYSKGITTREIADLIEKMYGCHYSAQSVSNITKVLKEEVEAFHQRPVAAKYACIYCDATYLNVRRGSTSKEALHVILGITPEGRKEVLDFFLCPAESSEIYRQMLQDLKKRGLQDVLLFISDALPGLANVFAEEFPKSRHQRCWVHISRNVRVLVKRVHTQEILNDLKLVYTSADAETAEMQLWRFLEKWSALYPKVTQLLSDVTDLFSFYDMPKDIRPSIYSNNLMESLNKHLKRFIAKKEQFPNEEALERCVTVYFNDYNCKHYEHSHRGFKATNYLLCDMF